MWHKVCLLLAARCNRTEIFKTFAHMQGNPRCLFHQQVNIQLSCANWKSSASTSPASEMKRAHRCASLHCDTQQTCTVLSDSVPAGAAGISARFCHTVQGIVSVFLLFYRLCRKGYLLLISYAKCLSQHVHQSHCAAATNHQYMAKIHLTTVRLKRCK